MDISPPTARVTIPVFTDRQSRSLPVRPVVTGTPAAGFEIASVTVVPSVVTVEGDGDQLAALDGIDTEPVSVSGLSSDQTTNAKLDPPTGVVPLDGAGVDITITLRQVTATRTFEAGLRLVGATSEFEYRPSVDRVLLTVGGSVADLDRLTGSTIVADLDVTGLAEGTTDVPVTADLPAGVTLVGASPQTVAVTITAALTPEPSPTATTGAPPTSGATPSGGT